jgi:threonyl-tRNA synthetase
MTDKKCANDRDNDLVKREDRAGGEAGDFGKREEAHNFDEKMMQHLSDENLLHILKSENSPSFSNLEFHATENAARPPQKDIEPAHDFVAAAVFELAPDNGCIVNSHVLDLSSVWPSNAQVYFIKKSSAPGLHILRHTAAHILAQAVKELYPETQIAMGPVIENGFYYDFYRDIPFQEQDLSRIEARMQEISDRQLPIYRKIYTRQEAIDLFRNRSEPFKVDIVQKIPDDSEISIYEQGDFLDLCKGPHLPSTDKLGKAFKLTKISGAYWLGDAKNKQLQRIYGTAWADEASLESYLARVQEAKKRDHRLLGEQMDLFHCQEEAPGSVFWHPNGWTLYRAIQDYIRFRLNQCQYKEVNTPQLINQTLWKASGHWDKFKENMFCVHQNDEIYALKPMNCPCHVQIFNKKLYSYRDLPLRLSEFGSCMRNEPSGARAGLMRLRSFVQDDAHIFCAPEQLVDETVQFCQLLFSVYKDFGFDDVTVRLSTRPEVRLGDDDLWDHAEACLEQAAKKAGLLYKIFPGEGAFYGPKLEFVLKDSLDRQWQCGTLQVDFILPRRLKAFYIETDGQKHHPIMIHRAILGSMERFIGVLLEHTGGHLPFWLAPVQGVILSISEKTHAYGQKIHELLKNFRISIDARNEKIGYKIREHTLRKVPFLLIVGEKEEKENAVMVRSKQGQELIPADQIKEYFQRHNYFYEK